MSSGAVMPSLPEGQPVPDWLNLKQAAQAFPALGERMLKRLIDDRRIPRYKPNGPNGRTLLKRADIDAWIEAGREEPVTDEMAQIQRNLQANGYGLDLPVNGLFDEEWKSAYESWLEANRIKAVDF